MKVYKVTYNAGEGEAVYNTFADSNGDAISKLLRIRPKAHVEAVRTMLYLGRY